MATYTSIFAKRFRKAIRAVGIGVAPLTTTLDDDVPQVTAGTGAASASDPNGSIYMRTDGAPEHRSGGAWNTVARTGDTPDFSTTGIKADVIAESTAATGVTIDSLLVKDGTAATAPAADGTSTATSLISGTSTSVTGAEASGACTVGSGDVSAAGNNGGLSGVVITKSGDTDVTTAHTGGASAAVTFQSGDSDCNHAGGTGGATGAFVVKSGDAASALGASGATGAGTIQTGDSADGNTGALTVTTGAPVSGGTSGSQTIGTGNVAGAGTSGTITILPGTVGSGVARGTVDASGVRTLAATTAVAITGAAALVQADSGGVFTVSQGAAYDIDLPSPTLGAGLRYTFMLTAPAANSVTLTVLGGAATFEGTIVNDVTSVIPATGATLTFVSGTAALGDSIEVISITTGKYFVRAVTQAAGGITIA